MVHPTILQMTNVLVDTIRNIEDAKDAISLLVSDIVYNSNKTVGFGTEWGISGSSGQHDIAMLKFCTKGHCVLDAKFVGIHIKDDLEKLRRDYGVVVKNPVELTELAAREWKKPGLVDLGPRELAVKLGLSFVDQRSHLK
ncbi:Protein RISC-INTERACTING CLEARING 3'-5' EXORIBONUCLEASE 1 [Linum perenne]